MHIALCWHSIRMCQSLYLLCQDLVPMESSLWVHIKAVQQDHLALQVMGVMWDTFDYILGFFAPVLEKLWSSLQSTTNAKGSGRKRLLG